MKIKLFNHIIENIIYKDVVSGVREEEEVWVGEYVLLFDIDCDIKVVHHCDGDYETPPYTETKQEVDVSNPKVLSKDYETEYSLNKRQSKKLSKTIEEHLNVIY